MILLPAESLGRKQTNADSLGRKPLIMHGNLGRKQNIVSNMTDSLDRKLAVWMTAENRENLKVILR